MKKIAVLFPGQGSQYVGMGKELYNKYEIAKHIFDMADDVLGFKISKICFEGDFKELIKTINTQPALVTVSYIMYKIFIENQEIIPSFLAGHSLGEISALCCCGAINFEDALLISKNRSLFMQECAEKTKGKMCAVLSEDFEKIGSYVSEVTSKQNPLIISNYNSLNQLVVSGSDENIEKFRKITTENGIKTVVLKTSGAFHSPFMKEAAEKFSKYLNNFNFSKMKIPVLTNVTADLYKSIDDIKNNLVLQIVSPVKWLDITRFLAKSGTQVFLECGPKNVLKNLTKSILPSASVLSLGLEEDEQIVKDVCI